MKRIKTYLRNTTGQDRLSGLVLLSIEREFHIDYDEIIKEFTAAKDKRKSFSSGYNEHRDVASGGGGCCTLLAFENFAFFTSKILFSYLMTIVLLRSFCIFGCVQELKRTLLGRNNHNLLYQRPSIRGICFSILHLHQVLLNKYQNFSLREKVTTT